MHATGAGEAAGHAQGNAVARARRIGRERLDVSAVDDGNAITSLHEMPLVVGRVQLASESDLPPAGTSERGRAERRSGHDFEVFRRPDLGTMNCLPLRRSRNAA
jgi:hypothetical protein